MKSCVVELPITEHIRQCRDCDKTSHLTYLIATSIHVLCSGLVALLVFGVGLRTSMVRSTQLDIRLGKVLCYA